MTIKGSLQMSIPIVKAFWREKFGQKFAKKLRFGQFWRKIGQIPSSLHSADLSTERFKRALKTFLFVW